MPENVTLVFGISAEFDEPSLLKYMEKAQKKKTASEHERHVWAINGLTVKQYEKKLVAQGSLNDFTSAFLRGLRGVKGLTLDEKNAMIFSRIFPSKHNAIWCPECKDTFLAIEGDIEGLDIVFKGECGHKTNLQPPIFMLTDRVLPDINILVSKSLSRLVELGYFNGFEVVFPEFILDVVDRFKGSSRKDAVSVELNNLRDLEKKGKIKINNLSTLPIKVDPSNLGEEDRVILELVQLTNSILVTSDKILKDRAIVQERPTVYISPDTFGKIKMIEKVRNP